MQIEVIEPPNRFISCVNGSLVYEYRAIKAAPDYELLYTIRVLHCMALNRVPRIARLVGIVVDGTAQYLRRFLLKYQNLRLNLEKVSQDPSISWNCREKWAKQIVECVNEVHSRGLMVGSLCNVPTSIDSSNNIHLWLFRQKFQGWAFSPCYPSEFRHLKNVTPEFNHYQLPERSSKADIFQLGMVLWILAEYSPWTFNSAACIRNRCDAQTAPCLDDSHSDAIALPPLDKRIPLYYRDGECLSSRIPQRQTCCSNIVGTLSTA